MTSNSMSKWLFLLTYLTQTICDIDLEAPMTTSWLHDNWATDVMHGPEVIQDKLNGCICKVSKDEVAICYGSAKCSQFPKNLLLNADVKVLQIKTTIITELKKNDFENLTHVESMEIEANNKLTKLNSGLFDKLTTLLELSISFNTNLEHLELDTFRGLTNLKRLKLVKNSFHSLEDVMPSISPIFLPNLESLSVNHNQFNNVSQNDFIQLSNSKLSELSLYSCQIENIEPASFTFLRNLKKLRLGGNLITSKHLDELFQQMIDDNMEIYLLNICESGLRKPNSTTNILNKISQLNVTHLIISRNRIENIFVGLFPKMPKIKILDLRYSFIVDIETNALNQQLLPNLEKLYLGGNQIPGITAGVLLPQLSDLDLSENSGHGNFPSYFDVSTGETFENMTKLTTLNLSYNRILTVSNMSFNGVHNLEILGLKNSTIYFIAEKAFAMLPKLKLLNLENNPNKPFNNLDSNIFQGLVSLEILLLSECDIQTIHFQDIFKPLINLKFLNLHKNNIKKISPELFKPLTSLTGLDFSFNLFEPWRNPTRLFKQNKELKVLLMSHNKFTYISRAMMDDFRKLKRLDLANNPFICECSYFSSLINWFTTNHLTVNRTHLLNSTNLCVSPDKWRNQNIVKFITNSNECNSNKHSNIITILVPCIFVFVLLITVVGLFIRYRYHIRFWIFLLKISITKSSGRKERHIVKDEFKYDAFVSYSNHDRNFIIKLVAMLENYEPYLKLCVYERDFQIGSVISQSVLESVESSRKTLLVVSDSFAKSQWCMWELHIAENHRLYFREDTLGDIDDSLVIVKLGPIANCHMTPTLRYLLKTRVYLEWNENPDKQKVFWNKLRDCLSVKVKLKSENKE